MALGLPKIARLPYHSRDMPIELSNLIEFLQRGIATIPPVVIAVVLLAGPTAALVGYRVIGYRMIDVARRKQASREVDVTPSWVCQACRSVNQLRLSRCYRCGRSATEEIELVVDQPAPSPTFFQAPAGSPFAELGARSGLAAGQDPGTPVMADPSFPADGIPVGPDFPVEAPAEAPVPESNPPRRARSLSPTRRAGPGARARQARWSR